MKRKCLPWGGAALALSIATTSSAQVTPTNVPKESKKSDLAYSEALSHMVAPIKSKADLHRYLKMIPPKSNALFLLSQAARERFVASATFNKDGLTGFDTRDLQKELSEAQIRKILALFGSESSVHVIAAEKRSLVSRRGGTKNFCFDADPSRPQFSPGNCDPGDGIWDEPFHPQKEPRIPIPIPPSPDPPPGSIHPIPLPNGDIYHMECSISGGTCSPHNHWICKARC